MPRYPINVADPKVFIGLLVGGSIAFIFSSLAIRAVSRTAGVVVEEVRRQFADGKIMAGEKEPDYGPAIDICTTASLRELATPALIAVLTPVIIGFGLGPISLGAFLASVIVVGQLMANFLSNAGGAWDNAKKYIEDGDEGGKGSEAHKAAVIGDTVGDPFKDTAGPALNPLIKVMNLVSLLILPAIIGFYDKGALIEQRQLVEPGGILIAVVAAVVVVGAIAFSKGVFSRGRRRAPPRRPSEPTRRLPAAGRGPSSLAGRAPGPTPRRRGDPSDQRRCPSPRGRRPRTPSPSPGPGPPPRPRPRVGVPPATATTTTTTTPTIGAGSSSSRRWCSW